MPVITFHTPIDATLVAHVIDAARDTMFDHNMELTASEGEITLTLTSQKPVAQPVTHTI